MTDGVVFGVIVAAADDVAVIKVDGPIGEVLGICRIPTALTCPAGTWYRSLEGAKIPFIGHSTEHGLVVEPIINGTPLLVSIKSQLGINPLADESYAWGSWSTVTPHATWQYRLHHTTHFLVGVVALVILAICAAKRRQDVTVAAPVAPTRWPWRIVKGLFGGWFGLGRDSFTPLKSSTTEIRDK